MKKASLAVFLLAVSISVIWFVLSAETEVEEVPSDMHAYLWDTYELFKQGEYGVALERHIWFHENVLRHEPSMAGVRLSFALANWRYLAVVYPPARQALIDTRDREVTKLRSGAGDWDAFNEMQAINERLDDQALTVEIFKYLHETRPELADMVWRLAQSDVVGAQHYELASQYFGEPMNAMATISQRYKRRISQYERWASDEDRERVRSFAQDWFVEDTLELIQVLVALGSNDLAEQIRAEALKTVSDPRLR